MSAICLQCFVSGRVQGVFYRRGTFEHARARGLSGYAKNLADGRVEIVICGEKIEVMKMSEWLWVGIPASSVTDIEVKEIPWEDYPEFEVRA